MKIMTILGSPKKKGNTAAVLGMFEEIVGKEHEVDRVNISDSNVKGCIGCYACQRTTDEPGCVQKDDCGSIIDRILAADAVIYATPLYDWSFTSQIKALLDRQLCLATGYGTPEHKSLIEGKKITFLVTCAGPVENNADLIQVIFDRMFTNFLKADITGKYVVPFCTSPDQLGDEAMETAKQMAENVAG